MLGAGDAALASEFTAAELWRLPGVWPRSRITLSVPPKVRRRSPGATISVDRHLTARDRDAVDGIPVTSVARTYVDLARLLPADVVERSIVQAVRGGRLDADDLQSVVGRGGDPEAVEVLKRILSDATWENVFRSDSELLGVQRLREAGVDGIRTNVEIEYAGIRVGEADLVVDDLDFIMELDGPIDHSGRGAKRIDTLRKLAYQALGYRVLRLHPDRLKDPGDFADQLTRVLATPAPTRVSPKEFRRLWAEWVKKYGDPNERTARRSKRATPDPLFTPEHEEGRRRNGAPPRISVCSGRRSPRKGRAVAGGRGNHMSSRRTRTLAILAAATLASLWLACPDGDGEPGDGNDGGTADSGGAVPDETFTARLTGAQEIPPTTVSVSGGGTFHYFHDGGVLAYRIDHDAGSAVVAGHIHRGHGGVNGPVIHPFAGVTSPISGTWVLDGGTGGADYADLAAGRLYVNLHQQGGAGVIRGQILRPGERLYTAALVDLGAGGTAAGGAAFVLSADAGSLSWHVTTNIPTTDPVLGSHIHKRSDNSVLLATPGIGNDGGAGNAPADPGLVTELEGDATYFNVHTQSMPTGRVQGDVLKQ